MPNQVWKCSKCKEEFKDHAECVEHEVTCLDKQFIIETAFNNAINALAEKYNISYTDTSIKIWVQDCDCFVSENYSMIVKGKLANGHEIDIYEPYYGFRPDEEDNKQKTIYDYIENNYISPYLDTKYEGVLAYRQDCDGYYNQYALNCGLEIDEICRRFLGKRVRIEIIQ
jgi:hypothetical protein